MSLRYYSGIAIAIVVTAIGLMAFPPHYAYQARTAMFTLVLASILLGTYFLMRLAVLPQVTAAIDPFDFDSLMHGKEQHGDEYPTAQPAKRPQMILAMAQSFFDDCPHFKGDVNVLVMSDFLSWPETAAALTVRQREWLETDENYRQVLPYVVVRQIGEDGEMRYLAYRRTSMVGEQRLAGKMSIGFGGHIDLLDISVRADSTIDLWQTILQNAKRELIEELTAKDSLSERPMDSFGAPIFANLFITHNEDVQRVHLGVVMYLDVPPDAVLTCREAELQTIGFLTADEIAECVGAGTELEVWSHLLVDRYIGDRPMPSPPFTPA